MQTAVAGLSANSKAVAKISENIANTGTVGYKRGFAAMVTTAAGNGAVGSGVRAVLDSDVRIEGVKLSTSNPTDLSISGNGFFLVSKNPNDPVASNYFLTRAGSFKADKNGNLRNAAGYFLAGFPTDVDGNIGAVDYTTVTSVSTVNVNDTGTTAVASTTSALTGNLPSSETGTGVAAAPFLTTMPYVNALGAVERLTLSWQPSDTTANLWTLAVQGHDGTDYGTVEVEFHDSGVTPGAPLSYTGTADPGLVAPAAFAVAADGTMTLTVNNGTTPQTLAISLGAPGTYAGVTQFAGDFTAQRFDVNGSEATTIASTEFDDDGTLWGIYENGERRAIYKVPVATVANPDGLSMIDGNAYRLSNSSGDMVLNLAGEGAAGSIKSYSLENANVDLAKEMTDLIQTQRNYSSNAKVITSADEMLQEVNNLKR